MLLGMINQIVCGNLTGSIKYYEFHVVFRCISAMSCAFMYTSGSMICKLINMVVYSFYKILKQQNYVQNMKR